jgi:site-specific DNA-methyltransferase (adenine-specific)
VFILMFNYEEMKNKIIHADCMDIMKNIPDKYFELAIVDPPYGLERFKKGGSHLNKYGSEDKEWNNTKPDKHYFNELFRISHNQIIWGGNNFELPTSEYFIIWHKSNAEKFSFAMCEMAWTSCKVPAKIFRKLHVENTDERIAPTQKPVALYRWILQNYAKPGDKIIDTHSGSGSLACACHLEKFDFLAIEKDADYYKASVERLETLRSQGTLF